MNKVAQCFTYLVGLDLLSGQSAKLPDSNNCPLHLYKVVGD